MSEDAGNGEEQREPQSDAERQSSEPERQSPEPEQRPEQQSEQQPSEPEQQSDQQKYADRCYRSPAGMAGGVVLLALGVWLVGDAVLNGEGTTPGIALAALVCVAPLVIAFTLRPAVYAGDTRLRIRNPFRTVTVPWGAIESVRAGYSSEVVADGTTYQLWAIPVSLRARKKAYRHNERISSGHGPAPRPGGLLGLGGGRGVPDLAPSAADMSDRRAPSDQTVDELRDLMEQHGKSEAAQGRVAVRWAYEVAGPALAGGIALIALLATR